MNKNALKHGLWGTPTYWVWHNMKSRCLNPDNPQYKNYGGRGITVCERWLDFRNFVADMGELSKGMTLERSNNEDGYEPGNVRWATAKEQARNRRSTKIDLATATEIRALSKCGVYQKDIAKKFNVSRSLVSHIVNGRVW